MCVCVCVCVCVWGGAHDVRIDDARPWIGPCDHPDGELWVVRENGPDSDHDAIVHRPQRMSHRHALVRADLDRPPSTRPQASVQALRKRQRGVRREAVLKTRSQFAQDNGGRREPAG